MPPRRRASTFKTLSLDDFLEYGRYQTCSPQVLFAYMQSVADLPQALGIPAGAGPPPIHFHGPGLLLDGAEGHSENIGRDEYIPLILAKLRDPRLPIGRVYIRYHNFLLARNSPLLISTISSFPNVFFVGFQSIELSENQFISLVRSYPNLVELETEDISIREYESGNSAHSDPVEAISVSASEIRDGQRGPELERLQIYFDSTASWFFLDLFASRRSPVALRNLYKLVLRHRSDVICNDSNFVHRLSRLISLCPRLWEIDIDNFNIVAPLAPLDLGPTIHEVRCCIFVTGNFKTDMVLNWWASTFNHMKRTRHLSLVTFEVEFDIENIPREVWNQCPTDVPAWAELDRVLTRPQLKIGEIRVEAIESTGSQKGFSMSAMSSWISTVCLPKTKKKYGKYFSTN